jgi:two-component system chemotaxis response regulator CheB
MLGIVSSTGGPQALVTLLGSLGKAFPLPILLVQHITSSFLDGFVSWLAGVTPFAVAIARSGETPTAGTVYLPPPDRHLGLARGRLVIRDDAPVCSQRPSGTVLLADMARELGHRGIGVILTGMGADGAEGLAAMRTAGAYTIAEDESTCVVFGMPAAAARLGAVNEMLPLPAIAGRVRGLAGGSGG